jgi:hypothetical protein
VIATRLSQAQLLVSQAQLLVLEKPGNALPSPISLPKQGLTFIEGQGSTCCANNSPHCRHPDPIRVAPTLRPDMIFGRDSLRLESGSLIKIAHIARFIVAARLRAGPRGSPNDAAVSALAWRHREAALAL